MLTVSDVRAQVVTSDQLDSAIQFQIDAAYADINERFGDVSSDIIEYHETWDQTSVFLRQRAASIVEIVESPDRDFSRYVETLQASQYRLVDGGRVVDRIDRQIWHQYVKVTLTPYANTARRAGVAMDLVKLALRYSGVSSESIGGQQGFTISHVDYETERRKILARLEDFGLGI